MNSQGKRFRFGDYEADFDLRELRKCGTRVGLQHKPLHVLELLLRQPGQLVTRKDLFGFLWPESHVSFEHGLNSAVYSLRQALGESSGKCHFIETRSGVGYRFIAPVEEVVEEARSEAYQDCLRGRYLLDGMSEESVYRALAYFNSADDDKVHSPLAHAGIADAYCQLALIGSVRASMVSAKARSSAELALRNSDLPEAHVSSGRVKMIFNWDWQGANEAAGRALELDANSLPAHTLRASLLCTLGDYEPALKLCHRALTIDPLSFSANLQFASCLYAAGDFKSSANQCWKILSLSPNFAPAQIVLALAYQQLGMYEEAVVEFQNARLCSSYRLPALSGLSAVLALSGSQSESEQVFNELSALAKTRYVSSYWQAVVCAGRGQDGPALALLEMSLSQRDPALLGLKSDARFASFRKLSRFQALLGRMGVS